MKKNEIRIIFMGNKRNKPLHIFCFIIFCLCCSLNSISAEENSNGDANLESQQQGKTITGNVADAQNEPIIGASVHVKGTTNGIATDIDGKYSLRNVPENAILVFTFIGMITEEVSVSGKSVIDVVLKESSVMLEEVVAIGYGTMRKVDVTGSVTGVKSESLNAIPVYRTEQALRGRASGVVVKQNSGSPIGRTEVTIRGANSMIGSNAPLYVVDGIPLSGGIEYLSSSDIESMNILKDASSTAIYGARGANGVIIVTTKQGQKGTKNRISFDSYYGIQNEIKRYEVLNSKQYATIANEYMKNEGQPPYFTDQMLSLNTDWQDLIFRTAPVQNYVLTFSGGNEKTSYNLSGNFYSQEGIIKGTDAKKGTLKISVQSKLNSIMNVSGNATLTRRVTNNVPVDNGAYGKTTLSGALSAPPTVSPYDENGLPTRIQTSYSFGSVDMRNPMIYLGQRTEHRNMDKILANVAFDVQLLDGLVFKSLAGIEYFYGINDNFTPIIYTSDLGYASDGYDYQSSTVFENTLSYKKDFLGKHSIDVVAGFTYQDNVNRNESASVTGLATNITENYNLGSASTINTPSNGYSDWTLLSWLGRANYSFMGKYLLTASVRADGSSRFGDNNKWGIFPSGAVAWRLSEEEFIKSISQISNLKLRTSYGVTGSTALSPYQSLSRLYSIKYIVANKTQEVGWVPSGISNADLRWETTSQFDAGIDIGLFNNRLSLTFDYYKKLTSNLLASVPLPPSMGYGSTLDNLGKIQNSGVEISIDAVILDSELKWNITGHLSANRNKVKEISMGSDIESGTLDIPFYSATNIVRIGEPFGMLYGYKEDGLDDKGLIKYKDTNKDGVVNATDRVIIGNPHPDFVYSINNSLSYKGLDLNVFIDASQGNDIFWATAGTHLNSFQRGHNQFVDIMGNYWTQDNPNPNAKYPKISSQTSITVSDRFIKDGSYIRLRDITLGYTIPTEKLGMPWFSKARIYVTGINLFTITNYPGLDPEANSRGTDSSDVSSRAIVGVDEGSYPSAKSFLFGINLSF